MHSWRVPSPLLGPVVALTLLIFPGVGAGSSVSAQAPSSDGFRFGIMLGGISLVSLTAEYQWGSRSAEVVVGTWAFQDVSLSVVGKQYLGPGGSRPFFGLGLWGVAAFAPEGTGSVLVFRAPIGVEWQVLKGHNLGAAMNINRAVWVDRIDPEDETPLNRRVVPLPAVYYRWKP
ncbi:MAG: hypothetical protein R3223_06825 [Longimicrobiales bacterium]|nr:hypothetical protein [Longimicrobiales bacterium]